MRSAAVLLFIGLVTAVALYCAQRPTVARGHVVAAQLVQATPSLRTLECQDKIPIGHAGATFLCRAVFRHGASGLVKLHMSRDGQIRTVENDTATPAIKKTSDPWGD